MLESPDTFFGCVMMNEFNQLGIVSHSKWKNTYRCKGGKCVEKVYTYYGVGLRGEKWISINPTIISETVEDYLKNEC